MGLGGELAPGAGRRVLDDHVGGVTEENNQVIIGPRQNNAWAKVRMNFVNEMQKELRKKNLRNSGCW